MFNKMHWCPMNDHELSKTFWFAQKMHNQKLHMIVPNTVRANLVVKVLNLCTIEFLLTPNYVCLIFVSVKTSVEYVDVKYNSKF